MTSKKENIPPRCSNGRYVHNWDLWYPRPEMLREDGVYYARECQQYGCDAVQHSVDLEPRDTDKVVASYDVAMTQMHEQIDGMKAELLKLMIVSLDSDWGPNPDVCRWCHCWLRYGDDSPGKPKEEHKKGCFAVVHLGRPERAVDDPMRGDL